MRRNSGYFDDPWFVRLLKRILYYHDGRERISESSDAESRPFRLIARREILEADLPRELECELLRGRERVVSAALAECRGDLSRVADAARDYFVREGICPACTHPLEKAPRPDEARDTPLRCAECGRRWS